MKKLQCVIICLAVLLSTSAQAQTFGDDFSARKSLPQETQALPTKPEQKNETKNKVESTPAEVADIQKALQETVTTSGNSEAYDPFALMSRGQSGKTDTTKDPNALPPTDEDDEFFVPLSEINERLNTPTVDGSPRGGQAFVMFDEKGNVKKVTNIFLFYDNFKIHHSFSNYTTCDVRFNIVSNLDRKLSQFDVKLVWPDITTTLSFEDINPYTQTYYNYTLLGEGCYSMDKAPNIVVNRCRAKGMTSSECASKIKWLSK